MRFSLFLYFGKIAKKNEVNVLQKETVKKYDFEFIPFGSEEVQHYMVKGETYNDAFNELVWTCPALKKLDDDWPPGVMQLVFNKFIGYTVIDDSNIDDFRLEVISRTLLRFCKEELCRNESIPFIELMRKLEIKDEEIIGFGFKNDLDTYNEYIKNNEEELEME